MKYTEMELQCNDIMWFGIDKNHRVFECTSGGLGNIPAFVINNKEDNTTLKDYFMNLKEDNCECRLMVDEDDELIRQCIHLAKCGIYCFDVNYDNNNEYVAVAKPVTPLSFNSLPRNIQDILRNNYCDIDVNEQDVIKVKHGF